MVSRGGEAEPPVRRGAASSEAADLEDQRDAQKALAAALQDGFFATTPDGAVVEANERFCDIVGLVPERVVGARPPYPWWPARGVERRRHARTLRQVLDERRTAEAQVVLVRSDGRSIHALLTIAPVRDAGGTMRGLVGTVKDMTERRQEAERRENLLELGHRLDEVVDLDARLDRLARFVAPRFASVCVVHLLETGRAPQLRAVAARNRTMERALRRLRAVPLPARVHEILSTAATTSGPTVLEVPASVREHVEEVGSPFAPLATIGPVVSLVVWPLGARGRTIGLLSLGLGEADATLDAGEYAFLTEVVARAAVSVDNALLYEDEQRARRRTEALQQLTAALGQAGGVTEALAALGSALRDALDADDLVVAVADRTADDVTVIVRDGAGAAALEANGDPPADAADARGAGGGRRPVFSESPEEIGAGDRLRARRGGGRAHGALITVPLTADGVSASVLCGFREARAFDLPTRGLVETMAALATQAVDRARLAAADSDARRRAERIAALVESLAGAVTRDDVARAAAAHAPLVLESDRAAFELLEASADRLVLAALADEPGQNRAPDDRQYTSLDGSSPNAAAVATGTAFFFRSRKAREQAFPSDGSPTWAARWGEASLVMPVGTGEPSVAVLSLVYRETRTFSEQERALAVTVAAHCAQALARAGAYEAELRERVRAEEAAARTRRLQAVADMLADPSGVAAARDAILAAAHMATGAAAVALYLASQDGASADLVLRSGFDARRDHGVGRVVLDADLPLTIAAGNRRPVILRNRGEIADADASLLERLDEGTQAWVALPVETVPQGVLLLVFAEELTGGNDDERFLLALARQATAALERGRLRERDRIVAELSGALAAASSVADVCKVVAEQAVRAFGAETADLGVVAADGQHVEFPLRGKGDGAIVITDVADVPAALALRSRQASFYAGPEELAARHPRLAFHAGGRVDVALAAIPIERGAIGLGVLQLTFPPPRTFDVLQRELLALFAARCAAALDRARLDAAEREARSAGNTARARLAVLERITEAALAELDLNELLDVVARELRAAFHADTAVVLVADDDAQALQVRAAAGIERVVELGATIAYGQGVAGALFAADAPVAMRDVSAIRAASPLLPPEVVSVLGAPLVVAGERLGVIHVGSRTPRAFPADDRRLMAVVADRVALAVQHGRRYEQERDVALTLQRSLLPDEMPNTAAMDLAARYIPARERLEIGGDWYDALVLADGRFGLVIGDVAGKGLPAAAVMGQLRNALRAYLVENASPADALQRLDRLMLQLELGQMATAVVAVADPAAGLITYACAGHPPPMLVSADGVPRLLEDARSGPLGVLNAVERGEAAAPFVPGSLLALYTDGLVERRDRPIDELIDRLREALGAETASAERTCDRLIALMLGDESPQDDVALLVARHTSPAPEPLRLDFPGRPGELASMRRELRRWLDAVGMEGGSADHLVLAASESCANAIEHAYGREGGPVQLEAALAGDVVRVVVRDRGTWRAPRTGQTDRGRGAMVMKALVDEVTVERASDGTTIHLAQPLRKNVARP